MRTSTGPRCRRAAPFGEVRSGPRFLGPVARRRAVAPVVRSPALRLPLAHVTRVALLGGGKMGAALVGGLLDGGWDADDLAVAEVDADRRRDLEAAVPEGARRAEPGVGGRRRRRRRRRGEARRRRRDARGRAAGARRDTLVLSIAAGVTIATLEAAAPGRPVVRAMPNTPALVGPARRRSRRARTRPSEHLELAERLLGAVGIVVRVAEPRSTPSPGSRARVRRTCSSSPRR